VIIFSTRGTLGMSKQHLLIILNLFQTRNCVQKQNQKQLFKEMFLKDLTSQ
jgi:hypothetical protein